MSDSIFAEKRTNSAARISIILAIVGLVLGLIPFLGWFFIPVWILAIWFGVVGALKRYQRGWAIWGVGIALFTLIYKIAFIQALFG